MTSATEQRVNVAPRPPNESACDSTVNKWWFLKFLNTLNIMSPKNLRIYVMMVAIYQVLISHVILFMMLLALTHAEEMINILIVDIADQKEREEYYEMPMNGRGESMNQVRFKTASQLATGTLTILYVCATLAATYVFTCLGLLFGTLKYRSELMVPWLVMHLTGAVVCVVLAIVYANPQGYEMAGGCKSFFWFSLVTITMFDILHWALIYRFYRTLNTLKKLTKSATVSIPCPEPGQVPYHFRKENMYIGDGGYKHLLTENCNPNYVV